MKGAYQRAKRVLSQHEKDLHVLAKELLDKETLSGEQIKKLLNLTQQVCPPFLSSTAIIAL